MKSINYIIAVGLTTVFSLTFLACKQEETKKYVFEVEQREAPASNEADSQSNVAVDNTQEELKRLVNVWNDALNQGDPDISDDVFASRVFYYTKELSRREVYDHRQKFADENPGWSQIIISDIEFENNDDGTIRAEFTKQTYGKKGENTYRAYLVFKNIDGEWKIVKESDLLTDHNVAKRKSH